MAPTTAAAARGRLLARPQLSVSAVTPKPGVASPGGAAEGDSLLYIPAGYTGEEPAPLAVMLHGAGGDAWHGLSLLQPLADAAGLLLLAPASRGQTWDLIRGGYGPDVARIDQALMAVFTSYAIDPARVAVGGFSDGASYALSLGLMNGALFTHIVAFSPGFMAPKSQEGRPRIFVAHGTRDEVLPIDHCSRQLVPRLTAAGYALHYHEFDGPHTVPTAIAQEAVTWYLAAE